MKIRKCKNFCWQEMECIFNDLTKIKIYGQIQALLCELNPIASDKEIDDLINQIPSNLLTQKDDLMVICSLFSYYSRNNLQNNKGTVIKLFEKILQPIKEHLQDESSFFWNIFGCLFCFKLWFYEEGLIKIEDIIQAVRSDLFNNKETLVAFFLPEIIEREPELFEKEIKPKITFQYSDDHIIEFKESRKKYFKWLRDSNNYNDPFYREIESDKLRLSIKTDDIDTFQKIFNCSNLSIDCQISESVLENYLFVPREIPIIEFVIQFNAVKIFKYLLMRYPDLKVENIFGSICQRNYEVIHIVESQMKDKFPKDSLGCSIRSWNSDVTDYVLNKYNYEYYEKSGIGADHDEEILQIFGDICFSSNFIFFENVFLPFLQKNPDFFNRNFHELVIDSFHELSCFFFNEFIKSPKMDVNYNSPFNSNFSLLTIAIEFKNTKAVEILLNQPEIDIFNLNRSFFSPFHCVCANYSDMKTVRMFCNHPNFNVNWADSVFDENAFHLSMIRQNTYVMQYLIDNFEDLMLINIEDDIFYCLENDYCMSLKILLKVFVDVNKGNETGDVISYFKDYISSKLDIPEEEEEEKKEEEEEFNNEKIDLLKKYLAKINQVICELNK